MLNDEPCMLMLLPLDLTAGLFPSLLPRWKFLHLNNSIITALQVRHHHPSPTKLFFLPEQKFLLLGGDGFEFKWILSKMVQKGCLKSGHIFFIFI